MNPCIVSVGLGAWYPRGVQRLSDSLDKVGYKGGRLLYQDELPPDCPPHSEMPYAFKPAALNEAIRRGHDIVVWCDAAVWFEKDPQPFFDEVEKKGYWGPLNGWYVSQWCSDHALPLLELTREEGRKMLQIMACFFALDMRTEYGVKVMEWYNKRSRDGSFRGPWTNENHQCSNEEEVLGHRHDQIALSVIWNRLGMELTPPPCLFEYYYGEKKDHVIAYSAGM